MKNPDELTDKEVAIIRLAATLLCFAFWYGVVLIIESFIK